MKETRKDGGCMRGEVSRRTVLKTTVAGAALIAAPALLTGRAAAATDLSSFKKAKIDWRQAAGASITIGVIPAGYFLNLDALMPQFKELTGINAKLEKTPPGPDPPEGGARPVEQDRHLGEPCRRPDVLPALCRQRLGRSARPLSGRRQADRPGLVRITTTSSRPGAAPTSIKGKPYGVPYDGETTLQVYRTDVYQKLGLKPAETLEDYTKNAAKVNDPDHRLWGAALRGFKGAGQNMYIYPSIFGEYGGEWFKGGKMVVNGKEAVEALSWYVNLLTKYAPKGVTNWNWPDIADAFGQGTLGSYIDANTSAAVIANPKKSKVIGKIGFARWPKGPSGKRVASIWNWSFPINGALSKKDKVATWLFIQWATSKEVQAATSYGFSGAYKRLGRQPPVDAERCRLPQAGRRHQPQLSSGHDGLAPARHRGRLAAACPAVAGGRRDHGDRHPGEPGRPGQARRCAQRRRNRRSTPS